MKNSHKTETQRIISPTGFVIIPRKMAVFIWRSIYNGLLLRLKMQFIYMHLSNSEENEWEPSMHNTFNI